MSLSRGRILWSFFQCQQSNINNQISTKRLLTHTSILFDKSIASFQEVKSAKDRQNCTLLIDVREPQELQETGVIPGSINIPLGEVESVLKSMSPEQFRIKYGTGKPRESTALIFSCRSGKRSADAQEIALKLGFKNVKNYAGGWLNWEEENKA